MTNNQPKYPLDSEILAFIGEAEKYYPSDNAGLSIADHRAHYQRLCTAFHTPAPAGILSADTTIEGRHGAINLRTYHIADRNTPKRIMYLHGGGFCLGDLDSHDSICAELAHSTQIPVVAVDYHLAPEAVFPVQVHDAIDAFAHIDQGCTVVTGDSAGATLAAGLCIAQRDSGRMPVGQVLIYPSLGGQLLQLPSYQSNFDAPGLTTADIDHYATLWTGGPIPGDDPLFAPLAVSDCAGLPPCFAVAAEFDPLCDDVPEYTRRLTQAGVEARAVIEKGLPHGYLRARHHSTKARQSFARICAAIVQMLDVVRY